MTRVIGITGGIGSGKSTVSQILAGLGAIVIDADTVGHETYLPGRATYRQLIKIFGNQIVAPDKNIDRKKLGAFVFADPEKLKTLNGIIHLRMLKIIKSKTDDYKRQGVKLVVLEAAGLFEANWASLVDEIWVVVANETNTIKRVMARTGLPEEQIRSRIRSQMSNEERIKQADEVIFNDGTIEELHARVKQLGEHLQLKS